MLARLPRPFAIVFALVLAALTAWCLTTHPPPIRTAKKGGYTDVRLYHDIVSQMQAGKPYHQAAAEMHRAHHYPLKPFFAMRLPTLAEIEAHFGWSGLQYMCFALVFAGIFAWVIALEERLHWTERVAVAVALGAGGGMVVDKGLMALQEYWGGMCITIALAGVFGWPRKWIWIWLAAALGLAVRELVLPFVLLALAFALWERRWKEAAAWTALVAAFVVAMAIHAQLVLAQVQPKDLPSPGWHELQGFSAFLKAVIFTSVISPLPRPLAMLMAMLPLVGWLAFDGRAGRFAALLIAGYVVMIAVFSRADTFYWGAIMLPYYFVGFALLPRAFWQLHHAITGRTAAIAA